MEQNKQTAPAGAEQQQGSSLPSWTKNYMDVGQISRLVPFFSLRMIRDRAAKGTMPFTMHKIGRSWYALKSDVERYWNEQQAAFANGQPNVVRPLPTQKKRGRKPSKNV